MCILALTRTMLRPLSSSNSTSNLILWLCWSNFWEIQLSTINTIVPLCLTSFERSECDWLISFSEADDCFFWGKEAGHVSDNPDMNKVIHLYFLWSCGTSFKILMSSLINHQPTEHFFNAALQTGGPELYSNWGTLAQILRYVPVYILLRLTIDLRCLILKQIKT